MPLGLPGPLRQRPAGRQGVAAVPAAKHVESLIGLPGSGACRRSPGGAQSGSAPVAPGRVPTPAASTAKPAAETAAPPPASNPPPAPKAAASTRAKKPSSAQVTAIRSACRNDYQQNCAGVPTGGAAALSCLEKNKANLSANCQKAVSAAGGAAAPAGGDAAAPAAGGALRRMQRPPVPQRRPRWCCGRCGPAK